MPTYSASAYSTYTPTASVSPCPICPLCQTLTNQEASTAQLLQSSIISIGLTFFLCLGIAYILTVNKRFHKYHCPYCNTYLWSSNMNGHLNSCTNHLELFTMKTDVPALKINVPESTKYKVNN